MAEWEWDKTDAGKPGMSGDIAKLFRHEDPKAPGAFVVGEPPAAATLMAREVIQNSWDAALELREQMGSRTPQFEIEFRFLELTGSEKREMVQGLDLGALRDRIGQIDRETAGLGELDCLGALDDDSAPLRVLKISERGATGMFGPWDQKKSHMYLALVSLGYTEKLSGAGGSYGYGKAGLIKGSRIRAVIAYTCFQEQPNEPGVTRRLLGMTYWGQHDLQDENYTGFGSLSAGQDGRIEPYINDEADQIATSVGIRLRDPQVAEQLGTTFLLFDPTVEPPDLLTAIERSWWPALQEADFLARVIDYEGSAHYPRPKRDELLRSFIDAWELASGARPAGLDEYRAELTGTSQYPDIGAVGLVADMSGWSYADEKAGPEDVAVDHKSLVALTRGPRMVVEYFIVGSSEPYLRGVFIADESIDDILRRTEPKAHDSWQRKGQEGEVDFSAAAVADHVLRRITQACNNQRARLKPPVPPPEDMNLPFFNDIMRRVMSGMGGGTRLPIPETRPISIHLDYGPVQAGDRIRISGSASFSLSDHFKGNEADVELSIAYRFLEDDRVGESAALRVTGPLHMQSAGDGVFRGRLEREREAHFQFESEPYESTWTGRLFVNGEVVAAPALEVGRDE